MCQKVHFKETKYSVSISNLFEEGLRDSVGDCDLMFMVKKTVKSRPEWAHVLMLMAGF